MARGRTNPCSPDRWRCNVGMAVTATSPPEFPAEDSRKTQLGSPDVRARLAALGIIEADGADAVAWARRSLSDLA